MEHERLDILAERFWEGVCTDAEEQELRKLVHAEDIPLEHAELKAYLDYTHSTESEDILGGGFDAQVMQEIHRRSSTGGGSAYPMWLKIAAGIVIILGMIGVLRNMVQDQIEIEGPGPIVMFEDTYDDPEMAYEEVKKALALVGMKMNDGMGHAGSLGMFDKAKEEICNEEGHTSRAKNK